MSTEKLSNTENQKKPKHTVKIKICGLSRPEDIAYVNTYRPEYIGFVFAKKSRRYVSPAEAARLKEMLDPKLQAVGVFVNEAPELIAELIEKHVIDVVQLHGQEDNSDIDRIKSQYDIPIIQAFSIDRPGDFDKAMNSRADYLLFDSATAGSGQTFDWSILQELERPYFLAGGLHPFNVKEALKTVTPFAVDVSSGVEEDGKKDEIKIKQFIQAVRE